MSESATARSSDTRRRGSAWSLPRRSRSWGIGPIIATPGFPWAHGRGKYEASEEQTIAVGLTPSMTLSRYSL